MAESIDKSELTLHYIFPDYDAHFEYMMHLRETMFNKAQMNHVLSGDRPVLSCHVIYMVYIPGR